MKLYYTLLLLFFCLSLRADPVLDSLLIQTQTNEDTTQRIQAFLDIGDYYMHRQLDSSTHYYQCALNLTNTATLSIQQTYLGKIQHYIAIAYTSWGYVKEGMEYGQRAIEQYKSSGQETELSDIYMVIGVLYGQQGKVEQGIELLLESIAIKKRLKALEKLGHAYMNLSLLYRDEGKHPKALALIDSAIARFEAQEFEMGVNRSFQIKGELLKFAGEHDAALVVYQKALEAYRHQKSKDIKGEVVLLNSIGGMYKMLREFPRALSYYEEALELLKQTDNKELEGLIYLNIGGVYTNQEAYPKALEFYNQSLVFYEAIQHPTGLSRCYRGIGNAYQNLNQDNEAIEYYTKATEVLASKKNLDYGDVSKLLAKLYFKRYQSLTQPIDLEQAQKYIEESINSPAANLETTLNRHQIRKEIYIAAQKDDLALESANQIIALSDSMFEQNKVAAVLEAETKYQTTQQRLAMENLEQAAALKDVQNQQQQIIIYSSLALLVLFIGLAIVIYGLYQQKQQANKVLEQQNEQIQAQNEEKQLLLKEIHHRVKNNLQIISSLLDLQGSKIEDTTAMAAFADGQHRVQSMALIHHKLYQNEDLALIYLKDYTQQLLDQILSMFDLKEVEQDLQIPATAAFDIDTAIPLGLIINELITNSCKYALSSSSNPKISICLKTVEEGHYSLELLDNGPGLPVDFNLKRAKSLGLRLVRRLSKQLFGKASYTYKDGACFTVEFKTTALRKVVD